MSLLLVSVLVSHAVSVSRFAKGQNVPYLEDYDSVDEDTEREGLSLG